jgi:hypothetical protein
MHTSIYQLEDGSFSHVKFVNLDSNKIGKRVLKNPIKPDVIRIFNEKIMEEDSSKLTINKIDVLADVAIMEAKRIRDRKNANIRNEKNKKSEDVTHCTSCRKAPDYTPGLTVYPIKYKVISKDGSVKEHFSTTTRKRKGSKFHRLLEEKGKELYDEYKPGGPGTMPAVLPYSLSKKHNMTTYMINRILCAYELKLLEA